jgi:asparagine synthase (glutamine-hydrolysing)
MCGIAGLQGAFSIEALERMSAAIAHRGPDDAGVWTCRSSRTLLAHRRLSIIDTSPLGHQPMSSADGAAVIVFNGEIYNYRELRSELLNQGHVFRTQSDTEVLLALYRSAGDAMVHRLNGIFAFAIYEPASDTLFLAGDEFAVKPLYFFEAPHGFLFASELKAIVASGAIRPELDAPVLFRTLGHLWSPGGATPLKGITRLGPGEALRVRHGRIVRRWQWAESAWLPHDRALDAADTASSVREALRTAVHRQLVADVPVGAFLSGGLDSTAVVSLAREASPGIECFTIDTGSERDPGVTDDLPYARKAAAHLGVKLHEVRIDASALALGLESMITQLDEPLADPSPLNVLFISRLARRVGMKVLLSGVGGDDLFSGYRRHRALVAERYWADLPRPVRRGLRRLSSRFGRRGVIGRRLAKAFAYADAEPDRRLAAYFLWLEESRIRELFSPEHRDALEAHAIDDVMCSYLASLPPHLSSLDRMLALEQRFFLADHNLLYTDKMGMAAGVEIRVPFLDKDVVRLANRLPADVKQRGADGKWILKKAFEPLIPGEIIHRAKTGFGAPVRQWLRHELRDMVHDTLSPIALRNRGLFDPHAVSRLIADDRAGRIDAAYTILSLMCIEMWCRRFVDAAPAHTSGEVFVGAAAAN